jgi:hypothetical protein
VKPASSIVAGDDWIVEVPSEMVSWREREARNEVRLRYQNEWIDAMSERFGASALTTFVCECGDGDCAETIELTKPEYESVRATSNRFAVVRDHENPESEAVISECVRFAVIDQIEGWGLRIARETDPRSGASRRSRGPA